MYVVMDQILGLCFAQLKIVYIYMYIIILIKRIKEMHKEGLITIMESNYLDKCVLKRDTPDCFFKKTPRRMGETLPGKFRRDERVQGSKPLRGIA